MEGGETIQFGNTGINRAAAIEMGEEAFKAAYKGKLNYDLNDAWAKIKGDKSVMMTSTDGNPPPKKFPKKDKDPKPEIPAQDADAK